MVILIEKVYAAAQGFIDAPEPEVRLSYILFFLYFLTLIAAIL
jgi:hypothetical protein